MTRVLGKIRGVTAGESLPMSTGSGLVWVL